MKSWWRKLPRTKWLAVFGLFVLAYLILRTWVGAAYEAEAWVEIVLLFALVFVTMGYAEETARIRQLTSQTLSEMREQRMDSLRPLVVPAGGTRIFNLRSAWPETFSDPDAICLRNVGTGPETNMEMRLELRSREDVADVELDQRTAWVTTLGVGDRRPVDQRKSEHPVFLQEGHWIVVWYDDVFGRSFRTEGRWAGDSWVDIRTYLQR